MKFKFRSAKSNNKFTKTEVKTNSRLYWRYILLMTFILVVGACGFGAYAFWQVEQSLESPVIEVFDQGAPKKAKIEQTLRYFEEREAKSLRILNSPSPVVDPSI